VFPSQLKALRMHEFPQWLALHVPHNATHIPLEVRDQYCLGDAELDTELLKMTDHHTLELFAHDVPAAQVVSAAVSRLVVDVERFEDDPLEPMAARGMGAVYTLTNDGRALRHALSAAQRRVLLAQWYRPHHARLATLCVGQLSRHGRCLVIDCHSFPSKPLPYEMDQRPNRPQICIGTDSFHTPQRLADALVVEFRAAGFSVELNTPFSGALVPLVYYGKDARVAAAMVEIRRDIYMDEATGHTLDHFPATGVTLRQCLSRALQKWAAAEANS
jgi:N-formylglutamate deformylase